MMENRKPRHARERLLTLMVCGYALVAVACVLRFRFLQQQPPHTASCLANVKNLSLALVMYADDYGACPPAAKWQETIMDYVKNPDIYRCPQAEELRSGFAYNNKLAGQQRPDSPGSANIVSIFETDRGWDVHGGPTLLPKEPRHEKGDNYGFADGHAKWVRRKDLDGTWFKTPAEAWVTWEAKTAGGGKK